MPNIERAAKKMPDPSEDRARFFARLEAALADRAFVRMVLAKPVAADEERVRTTVREIALGGRRMLSFVDRYPTRDVTVNRSIEDGLAAIDAALGPRFAHAHLFAQGGEAELRIGRRSAKLIERSAAASTSPTTSTSASTSTSTSTLSSASTSTSTSASTSGSAAPPSRAHDRAKRRWVDIGRPWLAALGVTDAQGRLIPAMARKWKQINKFVEILDHALAASALKDRTRISVVDFGSGKGYLTFAIHDHLTHALGVEASVTGVELRPDLVAFCNDVAVRASLPGLAFVQGDVHSAAPAMVDVMIALHACDTATDHALHAGVRAGAGLVLCSPCCHKELRPQMRAPGLLKPMLQHGIHLGQQAEMVTDTLRALRLEAEGYATQVFEFVALEHTSKNKMILATRRRIDAEARAAALEQIEAIKSFYGIRSQFFSSLLDAEASALNVPERAVARAGG
jgi:SAM-dependent methyltransferase